MRVIHIVHGRANPEGHNGISRVVYHLNKQEKALGAQSEIWAVVDGTKTHYTHPRDPHVTVECFPRVRTPWGTNEIIEQLIKEKDQIDLVHFHMIWFLDKNIIGKALNDAGIPFVITTHGTYTTRHAYTGKRKIARWLYERKFLARATEIHVLGREEGTGLHRYGYDGKLFVVPNAIDMDEVNPPQSPTAVQVETQPPSTCKAIWVGVLRDDKNLRALFKAVSLLDSEIRSKLAIDLVGPDYKGNKAIYEKLCKELGIEQNVRFVGPLYGVEKIDAIRAADFYVMPSHTEGMSLALLDAFACAKPALLTSGCGMNYYKDRDIFVTCEPYAQDIAIGITEMIEREEDWPEMGARALETALECFNWPAVARKMIENYSRIVEEQK